MKCETCGWECLGPAKAVAETRTQACPICVERAEARAIIAEQDRKEPRR